MAMKNGDRAPHSSSQLAASHNGIRGTLIYRVKGLVDSVKSHLIMHSSSVIIVFSKLKCNENSH